MGYELIADRGVSLTEERKRAKEALQAFPEAAALSADELAAAADRVVAESNPETATPTTPGMVRLTDNQISIYVLGIVKIVPAPDDGLPADGVFPPVWLEARRRQLDQQMADGVGVWQVAKIRVDLLTKGYVEVPDSPAGEVMDYGDDDEWWLEPKEATTSRATISYYKQ